MNIVPRRAFSGRVGYTLLTTPALARIPDWARTEN